MKFKAQIDIMPMDEILDPQGKVVTASLHNLGLSSVDDVRIGKHVRLNVDAPDHATAEKIIDDACKKLLANMIMERYTYRLEEVQ